jgi:micrococcal nuclease
VSRRRTRGLIGSVALLALVALVVFSDRPEDSEPGDSGPRSVQAEVERVIDGDTIEVRIGGAEEEVRYIGIDTPETVKPGTAVQCFGPQARALNQRLVEGRVVRLVFDRERRDVYGRLLAYVYAGPVFVNARLVRAGAARTLTIPPNDSHAALFRRLARSAGLAGRGLWAAC